MRETLASGRITAAKTCKRTRWRAIFLPIHFYIPVHSSVALFAAILAISVEAQFAVAQDPAEPNPAATGPATQDIIGALQARCVEAVRKAEKSVVAIARIRKDENSAGFQTPNLGRVFPNLRQDELFPTDTDYLPADYGAGVVIDSGGFIITTYHVLGDAAASEYVIWSQHRPYKATVVAADGWFDLAVLKVDAKDLQPLPFGDAKSVSKGEFVIALGNPQAIARDGNVSATWGLVSNLKRRAPQVAERATAGASRETLHHYGTLMHIDARLHLGYSGGALLNLKGEFIGLMTAYAGNAAEAQSASFAIPADERFQQVLRQLKAGKSPEFGFLGVSLQPLDPRSRRQGQHGSVVEAVTPGTAAARAEIQPGDVITHCNNLPIFDDDELIREVNCLTPGTTVTLRFQRSVEPGNRFDTLEKQAVLTKRSPVTLRPAIATVFAPSWRGMRLDDATAAPSDSLLTVQLPPSGGLYVAEVEPDSSAWKANIRAGTFITHVAGRPLTTGAEFFDLARELTGEVALQVLSPSGATSVQTVSP